MKYKILICGVGSIGERHIRNLLTLKYDDIVLYRVINKPLRTINVDFPVFTSLEKALKEKPDIAFICNPSHLHMQTAIDCAKAGCHLFIEKPLCNNLDGINELNNIILQKNKQVMIKGCTSVPVPTWSYLIITAQLALHADQIVYGEPCSAIKIFKKKK